jgi:predicted RNA-binding Zn ribbon-like protein
VRSIFEAGTPEATATQLNEILHISQFDPHMAYSAEQGWHLHPASDQTPSWRWLAAACGLGLTYLVMDHGADRLGVCAAPGCGRVFLDQSRPGNKRFCSLRCANRTHANAFRRRGRQDQGEEHSGIRR